MNTDLQDALIAWQGGELPAGRADTLLERLRTDVTFRREVAAEVWTLSLCKVAQAPDPRWLALHEEIGLMESQFKGIDGGFEDSLMKTVRREPLRFVSAWWRWAATAAALAVLVLSAALLVRRERVSEAFPETLAVLVPGSAGVPSRAVAAGPLALEHGQARLLFTNGVVVDIEGPADLQLLSVSRLICREGRLRTQVPKGAEGFCVETPRGAVTDLGTELGISVSRKGQTDVAVFDGQAELSVQIPGQEGMRTALLNVNERAGFQSTTGEIRTIQDASFINAVQPQTPELMLPFDYPQRILAAKPVHYWRMSRHEASMIPNEMASAPALLMAGGASIDADSHGHISARFRGQSQPGVLHLEKPWLMPSGAYAVEFWFMADTLQQMALAAMTTTDDARPHIALVEVNGRRPGEAAGAGILRYLLRWPAGHRDGMNLFSPKAAALPYQWHHVVAMQDEGRMQIYLNGRAIGPAITDAKPQSLDCLLQLGCLEYRPGQDLAKLRRPFSGRMAEVAVYDRLLTEREITEHALRR
ncbi:MAG: LamG-like jellyroll fold domain-containing protein [Verrucomicrobiota bacterium]